MQGDAASVAYYKSSFPDNTAACTVVCVKGAIDNRLEEDLEKALPGLIDQAVSVRIFYRPHEALEGSSYPNSSCTAHIDLPHIRRAQHAPQTRQRAHHTHSMHLRRDDRQGRLGLRVVHPGIVG